MNKYIYCLILCSMLLFYCCGERNPISKGNNSTHSFKNTKSNAQSQTLGEIDQKNNTFNFEQQKFNSLILGFNKIKKSIENNLKTSRPTLEPIYTEFIPWLLKHPDKQKELANNFTSFYNFLDEKRKIHANNKTFDEYITDAINAGKENNENGKYGSDSITYITLTTPVIRRNNHIWNFFTNTINQIRYSQTNEKKFKTLQDELKVKNTTDYYRKNWT
ncbi:Mlp family lipoprotein [Borrelia miyamotoi]|uniref:Mlp family lipoprotein n=1 Tax=Borrelia miyamotoi TaxID=47466 RepID=A0AAQ2WWN9_9SPIR|nr:Mlp family lipoprotein [Borrelia miyamotoi]AOW96095.1 hypothetical protein AXH25_05290 [Borrelia miyamotoi]QTL84195.1 Mlp family lipoprotein [Borrelia miyamotoi]WAZ85842.1 Mlp family lipoprotein [Borrelia miyamotoi]WAZ91624.1 Mlp family lipoprotein [Borrelia miyamotoi]WAZ92916.1 Mlp family lipoprotein [Borrelia miyamotoi]